MAKVKLHQLVRELEADFDERTDKDEANAQLCWFGYLEKTAPAYGTRVLRAIFGVFRSSPRLVSLSDRTTERLAARPIDVRPH